MVLFFPTSSFFENSGKQSEQFGEDLRDGILTHACDIWQRFPNFVTKGRNPASSFARGYMNSACSPIQTPPPINSPGFTGGQCCDKTYIVATTYEMIQCNGNVAGQGNPNPTITGRILGIEVRNDPPGSNQTILGVVSEDCLGVESFTGLWSTTREVFEQCDIPVGQPGQSNIDLSRSTFSITSIVTSDGSPDDCGNPAPEYPPETPPTSNDLNVTININSNDTVNLDYQVEWNQVDNNYNFPFNFKVNGVNVTLDMSGLTIFGNPQAPSSNTHDPTDPPGSDGGRDENNNPYTRVYPDQDYPANPDFTQPDLPPIDVDYLVCQDGVLETVTETIRVISGGGLAVEVILAALNAFVTDYCAQEPVQSGVPDVYPVLPGAERPCFLMYYKVPGGGTASSSTWQTTLVHPSQSAINNFDDLAPPDRTLGKTVVSVLLSDGSRVIARGDEQADAELFLTYLLSLLDGSFVPSDLDDIKVVSVNPRLEDYTVKCSQIEYYPNGKNFGVSPALLKRFDISE